MAALGIFVGTVALWLGVSTMWPSFLCIVAVSAAGLMGYGDALKNSMGNFVTCYVIFATMLMYALRKSGILDRIANWIVTRPLCKDHPWMYITLLLAAPLLVGIFLDVATITVVFFTVYGSVLETMGYQKGDPFATLFMMGVLVFTGISQSMSPIGHVNVVLASTHLLQDFSVEINSAGYIAAAFGTGLLFVLIMVLLLRFVFRLDVSRLQTLDVDKIRVDYGPLKTEHKYILLIYALVVLMWLLPNMIKIPFFTFLGSLGTVTPCLIGISLLCFVHVDGRPLMDFMDAFVNGTAWGAIPLVAGTMLLSAVMTLPDVGFVAAMTNVLAPMVGGLPSMVMVLFGLLACALMTNFSSNTVSYNVVYACVSPLLLSGIVSVNTAAFVMSLGYVSACAVATVAAAATTAMGASYGWIDSGKMFRYGMLYTGICIALLLFVFYPLGGILF